MRCNHVYAKKIRAEDGAALLWREVRDSASKNTENGSAGRSWTLLPWIQQIRNYIWNSSNGGVFPWKGILSWMNRASAAKGKRTVLRWVEEAEVGLLTREKNKAQIKKFMDHRWRGSTSWSFSIFWRCVKQLGYYLWTETLVGSNFAISGHLAEASTGGCHFEILPLTC